MACGIHPTKTQMASLWKGEGWSHKVRKAERSWKRLYFLFNERTATPSRVQDVQGSGLEYYRGPRVLLQHPWLTTLVCQLPMLGVRCREFHYVPLEKHKFEVYTHEECLVDPWSDQWLMITMTFFCFSIIVPSLDNPYTLEAFCLVTNVPFYHGMTDHQLKKHQGKRIT